MHGPCTTLERSLGRVQFTGSRVARRSPPANPRPVSESARDLERAVMVPVDHGRRSARRRYTAAPGLNRGVPDEAIRAR